MLTLHSQPSSRPARVVVMGAGGFVGAATVHTLRTSGIDVLPLTRRQVDLLAAGAARTLSQYLRPSDTLVVTSAIAPAKTPEMLLANLQMMHAVTMALQQQPVRHVVYVSSDAVYKDSAEPLTEESCAEPASLHGAMHLTREVMLRHVLAAVPHVFVRPTLIYGPHDPHNGYGPNRFLRLALKGEPIVLAGQGEERRDHIHVDDVAAIIVRCVQATATGVVNAVSGTVTSFRDIAESVVQATASASRITFSPRVGTMPHNGYRAFDASLLTRSFPGFRPLSFRDGLQRTLASQSCLQPLERS